ncbi:Acyl-CoA dehydrogenase [Paraburkholderia sacchari]|uniref:acyl-CoA dehydrogenase family protein n=1 Tax=Paraburkholderia sacchari TaxID=159450 RepID=UPI0039A6FB77
MKLHKEMKLPAVGLTGFETPLTEEEQAVQHSVHRFSRDVLRPLAKELDRMTAEQVIAADSPYWRVFGEYAKLGLDPALISQFPPEIAVRLESLIAEELGWGDAGLAVSLGVAGFPMHMAQAMGNHELIDLCTGKIGCWVVTQPDKGSDVGAFYPKQEWPQGVPVNRGNLLATVGADEIVINGQSSAWVSNGAVAQVALVYMNADYGDGAYGADGLPHGIAVIVPLDLPGISRGKPLDKVGQRSLPQGEIYFDNVRVPRRFAVCAKDDYYGSLNSAWSFAGTQMSQIFTGLARAAFELALAYAHERKQGGVRLIDHQLTRYRLGDMLRRVELCRSTARRILAYARLTPQGHPWATASAKVTVTEEAMHITSEAFRLFGGCGTSREYPIEKLLRDARAALIEDGENYTITTRLGLIAHRLFEEEGWTQN